MSIPTIQPLAEQDEYQLSEVNVEQMLCEAEQILLHLLAEARNDYRSQ